MPPGMRDPDSRLKLLYADDSSVYYEDGRIIVGKTPGIDSMLDATDIAILESLQANARTSNADIARKLGMAPSAILDRIRKLEVRGVIQGYSTRIDPGAVGLGLTAFILVRTEERVGTGAIGQALARFPEVLEVHDVAGEDCYLVKARVRDTAGLSHLLRERFGRLKGVRNTRSTIVLATVKESQALPLGAAGQASHDA